MRQVRTLVKGILICKSQLYIQWVQYQCSSWEGSWLIVIHTQGHSPRGARRDSNRLLKVVAKILFHLKDKVYFENMTSVEAALKIL